MTDFWLNMIWYNNIYYYYYYYNRTRHETKRLSSCARMSQQTPPFSKYSNSIIISFWMMFVKFLSGGIKFVWPKGHRYTYKNSQMMEWPLVSPLHRKFEVCFTDPMPSICRYILYFYTQYKHSYALHFVHSFSCLYDDFIFL